MSTPDFALYFGKSAHEHHRSNLTVSVRTPLQRDDKEARGERIRNFKCLI